MNDAKFYSALINESTIHSMNCSHCNKGENICEHPKSCYSPGLCRFCNTSSHESKICHVHRNARKFIQEHIHEKAKRLLNHYENCRDCADNKCEHRYSPKNWKKLCCSIGSCRAHSYALQLFKEKFPNAVIGFYYPPLVFKTITKSGERKTVEIQTKSSISQAEETRAELRHAHKDKKSDSGQTKEILPSQTQTNPQIQTQTQPQMPPQMQNSGTNISNFDDLRNEEYSYNDPRNEFQQIGIKTWNSYLETDIGASNSSNHSDFHMSAQFESPTILDNGQYARNGNSNQKRSFETAFNQQSYYDQSYLESNGDYSEYNYDNFAYEENPTKKMNVPELFIEILIQLEHKTVSDDDKKKIGLYLNLIKNLTEK